MEEEDPESASPPQVAVTQTEMMDWRRKKQAKYQQHRAAKLGVKVDAGKELTITTNDVVSPPKEPPIKSSPKNRTIHERLAISAARLKRRPQRDTQKVLSPTHSSSRDDLLKKVIERKASQQADAAASSETKLKTEEERQQTEEPSTESLEEFHDAFTHPDDLSDAPSDEKDHSVDEIMTAWDTRSIMEHPPESGFPIDEDPSWTTSAVQYYHVHEKKSEGDSMDMFDAVSWEATDAAVSQTFKDVNAICNIGSDRLMIGDKAGLEPVAELENSTEIDRDTDADKPALLSDTVDDKVTTEPNAKDNNEVTDPVAEDSGEDIFAVGANDAADWEPSKIVFDSEADKQQKSEEVIDLFDVASWEETDMAFSSLAISKLQTDIDIEDEASKEMANPLKDDEPLLAEDQARSEVDGMVPDGTPSVEHKLSQRERIEQYTTNDDGQSNSSDEIGEDEIGDDEDVDIHEVIRYVSADSDDDFDALPYSSVGGVNNVVETQSFATFDPSALAAKNAGGLEDVEEIEHEGTSVKPTTHASNERGGKKVELENLEIMDSNPAVGDGDKGDSMVFGTSVTSSSLNGEGLVESLAGMSGITATTIGTDGSITAAPRNALGASQGPLKVSRPAFDLDTTLKGQKSRNKGGDVQPRLFAIAPPPEEKMRKWEEEKRRPFKHLEAVVEANASFTDFSEIVTSPLSENGSVDVSSGEGEKVALQASSLQDTGIGVTPEEPTSNSVTVSSEFPKGLENDPSSNGADKAMGKSSSDSSRPTSDERDTRLGWSSSSVGSRDDAISVSLPSPPEVTRKELKDAYGLAPGDDGIWKEGSGLNGSYSGRSSMRSPVIEKSRSPISDSKMAERLALASSAAARKFEEQYEAPEGLFNSHSSSKGSSPTQPSEIRESGPAVEPSTRTSFFCAPDTFRESILSDFANCNTTGDEADIDYIASVSICSPARKQPSPSDPQVSNERHDDVHSPSSDTVLDGFDELELVGGAFSSWKNRAYAYGSDRGAKKAGVDNEVFQSAVAAASMILSSSSMKTAAAELAKSIPEAFVERNLVIWFEQEVLMLAHPITGVGVTLTTSTQLDPVLAKENLERLLDNDEDLTKLCQYVTNKINMSNDESPSSDQRPKLHSFAFPDTPKRPSSGVLAANFVSFLHRISKSTGVMSPFGEENPFLLDIVGSSLQRAKKESVEGDKQEEPTMQSMILGHTLGGSVQIVKFFYDVCNELEHRASHVQQASSDEIEPSTSEIHAMERDFGAFQSVEVAADGRAVCAEVEVNKCLIVPKHSPSPFETAVWNIPSIVVIVVGFLGDPVTVCRMKMVNRFCNRIISENEHVVMRDAVRLGGLSMNVRPAFWMWITVEKCGKRHNYGRTHNKISLRNADDAPNGDEAASSSDPTKVSLSELERIGREGKWHHVIQRDVARAFGNMPPHKTGARLRTDSIVRALVTWGKNRLMKRGVKGGGDAPPTPSLVSPDGKRSKPKPRPSTGPPPWESGADHDADETGTNKAPIDTVSDWGGISPVGSFTNSSMSGGIMEQEAVSRSRALNLSAEGLNLQANLAIDSSNGKRLLNSRAIEELALSGNALTNEMKTDLQNQLGFILHALAAAHEDVGYCQGMDYVVAHLLRVLQDTVRWQAMRGTLPTAVQLRPDLPKAESNDSKFSKQIDEAIDKSLVVEETVFRVMDTFFTTYNLRHMYWPELRCLKTCCRVFERLIQLKLPVLADHFEHHELNVGLFALGWFQTLFLYLPSMPSATVCHMWDIWLVERSFKIFFRVGTAILFLSQPILLNHELEGMMTYLNTFPDATLLNPDILIACALQIKVTNRILMEIEHDITCVR